MVKERGCVLVVVADRLLGLELGGNVSINGS